MPRENGLHLVNVKINNKPLRNSPYRVIVGTHVGDASLVQATGDGLLSGYIGEIELHCLICSLFSILEYRLGVT